MVQVDQAFMDWLVVRRSELQAELLRWFKIVNSHADKPLSAISDDFIVVDYMTAIGFSLWRAVFLASGEIDAQKTIHDAADFISKIILDNTIVYRDDTNAWSCRYYTHNAGMRLGEILKRLRQDERDTITEPLFLPEPEQTSLTTAWNRTFHIFRLLIPIIELRLKQL